MSSSMRVTFLVVALTAAMFPLALLVALGGAPAIAYGELVLAMLFALPSSIVAVLVERTRPTAWLGPMLALTGFLPSLALLGDIFKHGPLGAYAVALSNGSWVLLYLSAALLVLHFPTGRLRGRDRWLAAAIVVDAVVFIAVGALSPHPFPAPFEHSPHVFGSVPGWLATAMVATALPGVLVTLVLTVVSVVRRFRQSTAELRTQMQWLALGGMLLPLSLVAAWAGYEAIDVAAPIVLAGLVLANATIPVVIGIAVLRPALFDVNRALASAAAHAAATVVVLAVFTAANLGAGLLLPGDSVLAAVAATSLCALLLAPLRARLRRFVDRWFYPSRLAALAAIDELSRQTAVSLARPELLEPVLQEALADPSLRIGFRAGAGGRLVDLAGGPIVAGPSDVPVMLGGERVGTVSAVDTSPVLLREIAAAAAPTVEMIRLRLGLQQALHDAEASRSRILRVGYEERQRLERDLHDGAQLRLVSLGMALRLAQRHLPEGDVDVDGLLDQAVAELGTAVSELRQLAHGIRPSCLDDGLAPALSVLVDGLPIPVEMQVAETAMDGDLQTTAYYVASEAITNAVKHSQAERIALRVTARGSDIYVAVRDDGVGGAAQRVGSGLARLADRVSAHGGTLRISSPQDGGTIVEAILPCAS